ncbi:MAG TPA: EAL domain-containing protein [Methylophilaceae bacterium]
MRGRSLHFRWSEILKLPNLPRLAGLTLVYTVLAKFMLDFLPTNGIISIMWPPSGLALAAILLWGRKYWLVVFIGTLAGRLLFNSSIDVPLAAACGNTLGALAAVWFLRSRRFNPNLTHPRDFMWLALSGALSAAISAVISITTLWLVGSITQQDIMLNALYWWQGETLGVILFTPLLLVWRRRPQGWFQRERVGETVIYFTLAFLAGQIIFLGWFHGFFGVTARGFWMFLFVVWAAVRFGRHGASLILCMTAFQMLLGTVLQSSGFTGSLFPTGTVNYWFYMMALTVTGFTLSLVIEGRRLAEASLSQSYDLLDKLSHRVPGVIYQFQLFPDGHSCFPFASEAMMDIFEVTPEQVREDASAVFAMLHPEDYDRIVASIDVSAEALTLWRQEFRMVLPNQGIRWRLGESKPERQDDGSVLWHGFITDITERKRTEQRIQRLTDLYKALSEVNQAIVRMEQHTELFPLVCRCAVEFGNMKLAWVGQVDRSSGLITPVASYGDGDAKDYLNGITVSSQGDVPEGRGPTGTAFREHRIIIVNDHTADSRILPWQEKAAEFGWNSTASFPIRRGGSAFAVLTVYHAEPNAFDNEMVALLEEMSTDITFALDNFDREVRRKQAEVGIELSEWRLRFLNEVTVATQALTEPREIMATVARMLGERLQVSRCAYADVADDGDGFTIQYDYNDGCKSIVGDYHLSLFGPRAVAEMHAGRTLVINDVDEELQASEGRDTFNAIAIKAIICCPLVKHGKLRAMMAVHQDVPRLWTVNEITLAEEVIARCWAIIERARAEDALRESEQQNRAVFEQAAVGVAVIETDSGRFVNVNERYCEITGYSDEQMTAMAFTAITHPDDLPTDTENMRKIKEGSIRSLTREKRYIRQDGSTVWVSLTLSPMAEPDEPSVHAISVVEDITERKQAEESMRLSASVYETSSEAMAVTDADDVILTINPAFTRITGYSPQDVIGKHSSVLSSSSHHDEAFYRGIWQEVNTAGRWQGERWDRRKNGEEYAVWLTINNIFNEDGSVHRRVSLFSDITEWKKSQELIWHQANYDPLTRLPNRQMFQDRMYQEIKKSHRASLPLALLFLDLDRFKEINDTLGHDMGDILLIEAAKRLTSCVRETDTVARLGGDEFTIILGELDDPSNVDRVTEDILQKLASPFQLGSELAYISASIGITLYPADALTADALLKNADQAMYAAKNQGRNRYHYFTQSMQLAAQARLRLMQDLRKALDAQQFRVYYQPIVELASGAIHKAEALIRWEHPKRGLIGPVEFIGLAEETGLINDIGEWVFRQAAQQAGIWRESHHPDFQISVNKSPVQFHNEDKTYPSWPLQLHAMNLPARSIVVEITEGLLLNTGTHIMDRLQELRDAGIQVSLDDFGTGYSSLSYLNKFAIDFLKIDQSFVRNLTPGSSNLALCEAIIVMAHKLGMKVIAEGIEAEQQRELLSAAGCDYGQGYLFSKPVPALQFATLLKKT